MHAYASFKVAIYVAGLLNGVHNTHTHKRQTGQESTQNLEWTVLLSWGPAVSALQVRLGL